MHSLRLRGAELLRCPPDSADHLADPLFWGAYVMAPWCNRITPETVTIGRRAVDLAPNFPDGSAIHGQVYAAPWEQVGDATFAIERDGEGWPWRYRVEISYSVSDVRVAISLRLQNLSDETMPGGIGLHPWFPVPVDVRINSGLTYGSNSGPSTVPVPALGILDVRSRQPLSTGVDATWSDPDEPPVELWWREHGIHATMRAPSPTLHIVAAYAPERGAIAVEPETNAPQPLRRYVRGEPGALTPIEPGGSIELPITIDFDTIS